MVSLSSKFYTVYNVLFHEDGEVNSAVTNWMSHFYMFFPTKATVKLDSGNTVHVQLIGTISCNFTNCTIIYPVGPVYYFPGQPYNTISFVSLKFYIGF